MWGKKAYIMGEQGICLWISIVDIFYWVSWTCLMVNGLFSKLWCPRSRSNCVTEEPTSIGGCSKRCGLCKGTSSGVFWTHLLPQTLSNSLSPMLKLCHYCSETENYSGWSEDISLLKEVMFGCSEKPQQPNITHWVHIKCDSRTRLRDTGLWTEMIVCYFPLGLLLKYLCNGKD